MKTFRVYCRITYDQGRLIQFKTPTIDAVDEAAAGYIARDRYSILGDVTVSRTEELFPCPW